MGLWYAFFPLFCVVAGIDDSNAPAPERIQVLLKQLAIPEVFKAAGVYGDDMDFEDGEGDEMTFLAGWATPFNECFVNAFIFCRNQERGLYFFLNSSSIFCGIVSGASSSKTCSRL